MKATRGVEMLRDRAEWKKRVPSGAKARAHFAAVAARLKPCPVTKRKIAAGLKSCPVTKLGEVAALLKSCTATKCRIRSHSLLIILGVLLIVPLALAAQDDASTFRMDVKLVNVFVNVTDKAGAIVGGLGKDDFQVLEDGHPQKIAIFERQSELPLNLVLAIDTSGSTAKDLYLEQSASKHFIHALLREQDAMSLIQFATDVRQLVPFTNKASQLDHGLNSLRGGRFHRALRRHLPGLGEPGEEAGPQSAGARLRRRRHGQEHYLPGGAANKRCAVR